VSNVKRLGGNQLDIACEGNQARLDDDPLRRWYVHQDLSSWRPSGSFPDTTAKQRAGARVEVGAGKVTLTFPKGMQTIAPNFAGVTYDYGAKALGPARFRMVGGIPTGAIGASNIFLYCRGHDAITNIENGGTAGTDYRDLVSPQATNTLTTFNTSDDFNGGETYRYVTVFMYYNSTATLGNDFALEFTQLTGYADATYDGGIAGEYYSALRASAVFEDIRDQVSGLSSESAITGTSFDISELGPQGYKTPRQYLIAANAYHDYLWGVDAHNRLYFTPRPTASALRAGTGLQLEGDSLSSTARNFNRVLVQAVDPTGGEIVVERTTANGLLDRQGVTRAKVLSAFSSMPQATAEVLGDAWLAERGRTPARGSITARARGDVTDASGQPLDPVDLLAFAGQRIRLDGEVDPDTGELGRSGIVRAVSFSPGAGAKLSIDDETDNLQIVLNRYAANLAGGG
jgi:hypothetical protein